MDDGFENEPPAACEPSGGLGGAVSIAKVEPEQMPRLAWCAGLLNRSAADELGAWVARQRYPLRQRDVSVQG